MHQREQLSHADGASPGAAFLPGALFEDAIPAEEEVLMGGVFQATSRLAWIGTPQSAGVGDPEDVSHWSCLLALCIGLEQRELYGVLHVNAGDLGKGDRCSGDDLCLGEVWRVVPQEPA